MVYLLQYVLYNMVMYNVMGVQDMSHNALTVLPPGVGFLTRLTHLLANNNHIGDVPPDVGNLRGQYLLPLSVVTSFKT